MANMTTTGQVNPTISGAYAKRLLSRLVNDFIHYGYGAEKPLQANSGPTLTFGRFANLSAATTALTQGVTPAGSQASRTEVSVTVYQYGDFIIHTDWLNMVGIDGKVTGWVDGILKDQVRDTLDQLARAVIYSSTNIRYSDDTGTSSCASPIDVYDVNYVINYLKRNAVPMIREKVRPSTGISTSPLKAGYIAVGHVDLQEDIEAIAGFIPVEKYAQPGQALEGEIGALASGQIRVVLSANGWVYADQGSGTITTVRSTSGSQADVYGLAVFGKEFYCNSRVNGNALEMIIKQLGSSGTEDPLNQRGSAGWKLTHGGTILEAARGVIVYCACTDPGKVFAAA